MKELMENVLPYLGIEPEYTEKEAEMDEAKDIVVPNFIGMEISEVKKTLTEGKINYEVIGEGETVRTQFPPENEVISNSGKIILYTE
ncbi:MAG: PASTA domain-containing protein [Eubacteriales bacterium]|nr:PASTA domain-containing protein [Eubacteriales bacterium]